MQAKKRAGPQGSSEKKHGELLDEGEQSMTQLHAGMTIEQAERILIEITMAAARSQAEAAAMLGISERGLRGKIKKMGIVAKANRRDRMKQKEEDE